MDELIEDNANVAARLAKLASISRMIRAYVKEKTNSKEQEVQAMQLDDSIVVASNFAESLEPIVTSKRGVSAAEFGELVTRGAPLTHDLLSPSEADQRALAAALNGVSTVLWAAKATGAVRLLLEARKSKQKVVLLLGDALTSSESWHAEQKLLYVLWVLLHEAVPSVIAVAGTKPPCTVCYPEMRAHLAAFYASYGNFIVFGKAGPNIKHVDKEKVARVHLFYDTSELLPPSLLRYTETAQRLAE